MRKLGFTLAEVLITLVIIGVIAAMTVPTLMQNTNQEEFRTGIKKAISAANQALTLNYALEGVTASDVNDGKALINEVFRPRMSTVDPENMKLDGYTIGGKTPSADNTFITNDGIIYLVDGFEAGEESEDSPETSKCNSYQTLPCGGEDSPQLYIDVNGIKKPNQMTTSAKRPRDQYQAQIYSQKIVPFGEATQGVMYGVGTDIKDTSQSASAGS